ncbi:MAG: putative signal transducing protein [Rubripirellula sp.]
MKTESHEMDDAKLVTVAERDLESAALILVSVLKDAGIRAIATGGFTAGFRAEAPGAVKVQTFEVDAERARQVISEIRELPDDMIATESRNTE